MLILNIAICDDSKQEQARLGQLLHEYKNINEFSFELGSFYSGIDFISDIKNHNYDLIFINVAMPAFSGIEIAKEIRLFNKAVRIVFLSPSTEIAMESYSVGVYGYLLKPVVQGELFSLLNRILAEADTHDVNSIVLKSHDGIVRIPFFRIEYVEVMNKTVSFHLIDGSVRDTTASLSDFEPQLLSRADCLKIHRSFLINLNHIQTLNSKGITTQTGHTLPVSKLLYTRVKESYMKYLFLIQPKSPNAVPAPKPPPCTTAVENENNAYRVLLIDDEPEQQQYWSCVLQANSCNVDIATNAEVAAQLATVSIYDCIVLDVMLFGESSFPHCKRLRELTSAPVVFLSSLTDSDNQLKGFLSGGIDYVTKDTPPELFWAKIEARIRLSRTGKVQLTFEPLLLDLSSRKVTVSGDELMLTPIEFDLLWLLAEHVGRIYTPDELYHSIWGSAQWDGGQSIQVHMSRMRRKLERACPSHYFIETAWGKGYRFVPKPKQEDAKLEEL